MVERIKGSFRDPSGYVYKDDGRIYRTINEPASNNFLNLSSNGFYERLISKALLIDFKPLPEEKIINFSPDTKHVIEHPYIPFISYPYEWSFSLLKSAALQHLDIQLLALKDNVVLSDASAFNIQFIGPNPLFIDLLSFKEYNIGQYWNAHNQFCEQFLNPLILYSDLGVPFNSWYRGSLSGISTVELSQLLPRRKYFSFNFFTHVFLQSKLESKARKKSTHELSQLNKSNLPKNSYKNILLQLHSWISKMQPKNNNETTWGDYTDSHGYDVQEMSTKKQFIEEYCNHETPELLYDLGCNTGEFSTISLASGAKSVIGFDVDHNALERAYKTAKDNNINLLPLYFDATNPAPDQGWNQSERSGLQSRAKPHGLLALAFLHHLVIGKNIPLEEAINWLINIAPTGIIEFIQKDDPRIKQMLALREDIFHDYNEENFVKILSRTAKIVKSKITSKYNRTLFWYQKS